MEAVTSALQSGTRRVRIEHAHIDWSLSASADAVRGEFSVPGDILQALANSFELQVVLLLCIRFEYLDTEQDAEMYWAAHGIVDKITPPSQEPISSQEQVGTSAKFPSPSGKMLCK